MIRVRREGIKAFMTTGWWKFLPLSTARLCEAIVLRCMHVGVSVRLRITAGLCALRCDAAAHRVREQRPANSEQRTE